MRRGSLGITLVLVAGLVAACSSGTAPAVFTPAVSRVEPLPRYRVTLAPSALTPEQQIVHVLDRLGYGPRPGEVERVRAAGLATWIERQLEPARIVRRGRRARAGGLSRAASLRGRAVPGLSAAAAPGPPTGHPDVAEAWVSAGALLSRMNFALALTHNRLPGARVDLAPFLEGVDRRQPAVVLDRLFTVVLRGQVSPATRRVLGAQLGNPEIVRATADDRGPRNTDGEKLSALVLGSPEFQRR
jgi:hypothetical protein